MGRSFAAEVFKARKRPATWTLALIWVIVIAFSYFSTYAFIANAPPPEDIEPPPGEEAPPPEVQEQIQAEEEAFNEAFLESLYPENLVANLFSGGLFNIGGALALILGALAIGSEYGWGTFKTALTQRPGRLGVLSGKLLAFAVVLAALVLLGFAAAALCGFVVARLEGATLEWPSLATLARGLGAGALIFAVWGMLGFALAALFRGTALAIGIGLAWLLAAETLISGLAGPNSDNETLETIRKTLPGENAYALSNSFGSPLPEEFTGPFQPLVEPEQAVWALAAYAAGFVLVSALLVWRRDVT
jgi:ABC-type transport system involved in multi-copper enzyme maturation permease subunit